MTPISLSIDLLRIDAGTQSRSAITEEVVDDYAEVIEQSPGEWPFPPLDVFHDGSEYYVSDGFHRLLAALRVKRASVPCRIHKGSAMDAHIFGMTANDKHGLRMTRADKRENVIWLLDHGGKLTQAAISEKAGVSIRTVRRIISERNPASLPGTGKPPARDGKRTMSSNTPIRGGSEDPFDEPCPPDDDSDLFECAPEKAAPPTGKGTPGKQYDSGYWFKQWEHHVGPLVRLVDKISDNITNGSSGKRREIQVTLNLATKQMMVWLGVKE